MIDASWSAAHGEVAADPKTRASAPKPGPRPSRGNTTRTRRVPELRAGPLRRYRRRGINDENFQTTLSASGAEPMAKARSVGRRERVVNSFIGLPEAPSTVPSSWNALAPRDRTTEVRSLAVCAAKTRRHGRARRHHRRLHHRQRRQDDYLPRWRGDLVQGRQADHLGRRHAGACGLVAAAESSPAPYSATTPPSSTGCRRWSKRRVITRATI